MSKFYIFLALILYSSAWGDVPPGEWEKIKEKDGVTVYRKEVPGSDVLAFKGDGMVDAPLEKVATVIFDTTRGTEWIEDLEESRLIRWVSPTEFIEYDHIGTPFVMKDRDFLSKVRFNIDKKNKKIEFNYESVDDPAVPLTKYIRGELKDTRFILTKVDSQTRVEGEIHCDPKGSVAKWIVNLFQKGWPVDTLNNLRKQLKKPDIKVDTRFAL